MAPAPQRTLSALALPRSFLAAARSLRAFSLALLSASCVEVSASMWVGVRVSGELSSGGTEERACGWMGVR